MWIENYRYKIEFQELKKNSSVIDIAKFTQGQI